MNKVDLARRILKYIYIFIFVYMYISSVYVFLSLIYSNSRELLIRVK